MIDYFAPYAPQLLLAFSIQMVGLLSPGPGFALILSVAASRGVRPALTTSTGIACASLVFATITVLGLSAVLTQAHWMVEVVRLIGAGYLLWLAYKSYRTAFSVTATLPAPPPGGRTWLRAFLLQVTNPKAMFFWLAIAAAGGIGHAPWPVALLFILGAFLNSLLIHSAFALLLASGPVRSGYRRARRGIEGALGTFFALFALRLTMERS